jgi:hypothetical protein
MCWRAQFTPSSGGAPTRTRHHRPCRGLPWAAEPHRFVAYTALREMLAGACRNGFYLLLSRWSVPRLAKRVGEQVSRCAAGTGSVTGRSSSNAAAPQGPEHGSSLRHRNLLRASWRDDGDQELPAMSSEIVGCVCHANDATIAQPYLSTLAG